MIDQRKLRFASDAACDGTLMLNSHWTQQAAKQQ